MHPGVRGGCKCKLGTQPQQVELARIPEANSLVPKDLTRVVLTRRLARWRKCVAGSQHDALSLSGSGNGGDDHPYHAIFIGNLAHSNVGGIAADSLRDEPAISGANLEAKRPARH